MNKRWYCQEDGGQWNVPVQVIYEFEFRGFKLAVISGAKLTAPLRVRSEGVMVVSADTLHDIAQ